MRVLHGKGPMPHSTCPVADLRQVARLPRRCANVRRSLRVAAQTAGTKERQKASTETAKAKPTPSADTTHVSIQTGEPTDPDHVTNGVGSSGPNIEVDSVLAKELSENGVYNAYCYGDQSRPPVATFARHARLMLCCVFVPQASGVLGEPKSFVRLVPNHAPQKCWQLWQLGA